MTEAQKSDFITQWRTMVSQFYELRHELRQAAEDWDDVYKSRILDADFKGGNTGLTKAEFQASVNAVQEILTATTKAQLGKIAEVRM